MISYRHLIPGKEYYIKSYDTQQYFKMIFIDYQTSLNHVLSFDYHINMNMIFKRNDTMHLFYQEDYYYDPVKIREKSQNARQTMEQRSLNIILKRLVNEEFQWL